MEVEIKITKKITLPAIPLSFQTNQGRLRIEDMTREQVECVARSWGTALLNKHEESTTHTRASQDNEDEK